MNPVFSLDHENKIYGGGFTLDSLKSAPNFPTLQVGGSDKTNANQFINLFSSYAIPLGLLSSNAGKQCQYGGKKEDTLLPDQLHAKLLELVKEKRVKKEKTKKVERKGKNNKTKKNFD